MVNLTSCIEAIAVSFLHCPNVAETGNSRFVKLLSGKPFNMRTQQPTAEAARLNISPAVYLFGWFLIDEPVECFEKN